MTPVRSSMAEVLLCLKRDSSDGMDSQSEQSTEHNSKDPKRRPKVEDQEPEVVVCNCKKSRCLKLYCQCFAGQIVCNPHLCKCTRCANTPSHGPERAAAVRLILERNPAAFDSKFKSEEAGDDGSRPAAHKTGCRCRKSMCLKKYCECFHAGVSCSASCTCLQCSNTGSSSSSQPPSVASSSAGTASSSSLMSGPSRHASALNTPAGRGAPAKRSPPLDTPEAAAVMRAVQDLALLRNKDSRVVLTPAGSVPVVLAEGGGHRGGPPGISACAPSSSLSPASFCHLLTPSDRGTEVITLGRRKRGRADSPVHEPHSRGGSGSERPPAILSRGGGAKQKSPPLSTSSSSVSSDGKAASQRPLVHPNSHLLLTQQQQLSGDAPLSDLGALSAASGPHFKRQAPPTLRTSSASPNSLYCASALSLLSGRDMSPQALGASSNIHSAPCFSSSASFFAASPAPFLSRGGGISDSSSGDDDSAEKWRKRGASRRPHSSSMDNTSEEDATSASDSSSPYWRALSATTATTPGLPPPPPPLLLPGAAPPSSAMSLFCHAPSFDGHSSSAPFLHLPQSYHGGNWTKPVVDVMSNMS